MKNNQLSEKEHEMLELFNQADSDTQEFLVWAVKYIVENDLKAPINFRKLEELYHESAV